MKVYIGERRENGETVVTVGTEGVGLGVPLDPRFDLYSHSPTGFEWGYAGSGPAQLALAICADFLGDDQRARRVYQEFKENVIAPLEDDIWGFTEVFLREQIALIEGVAAPSGEHARQAG